MFVLEFFSVVCVQVKNIGFTGVFRLIFKPLVDEFPCFGALSYSLREKVSLMTILIYLLVNYIFFAVLL